MLKYDEMTFLRERVPVELEYEFSVTLLFLLPLILMTGSLNLIFRTFGITI